MRRNSAKHVGTWSGATSWRTKHTEMPSKRAAENGVRSAVAWTKRTSGLLRAARCSRYGDGSIPPHVGHAVALEHCGGAPARRADVEHARAALQIVSDPRPCRPYPAEHRAIEAGDVALREPLRVIAVRQVVELLQHVLGKSIGDGRSCGTSTSRPAPACGARASTSPAAGSYADESGQASGRLSRAQWGRWDPWSASSRARSSIVDRPHESCAHSSRDFGAREWRCGLLHLARP